MACETFARHSRDTRTFINYPRFSFLAFLSSLTSRSYFEQSHAECLCDFCFLDSKTCFLLCQTIFNFFIYSHFLSYDDSRFASIKLHFDARAHVFKCDLRCLLLNKTCRTSAMYAKLKSLIVVISLTLKKPVFKRHLLFWYAIVIHFSKSWELYVH